MSNGPSGTCFRLRLICLTADDVLQYGQHHPLENGTIHNHAISFPCPCLFLASVHHDNDGTDLFE